MEIKRACEYCRFFSIKMEMCLLFSDGEGAKSESGTCDKWEIEPNVWKEAKQDYPESEE